jgi:(E)-4-hydroxy-3-methylbut-2-enyl-diphosphate synthase
MITRKKTRKVRVGNLFLGGGEPIRVQSMTNTPTEDEKATAKQVEELIEAGCEIVRLAIRSQEALKTLSRLKKKFSVPLVADIHFNYRLALASVEAGADKIRINPGTIGGEEKAKIVVAACQEKEVPIRLGLNSGSLPEPYSEIKDKAEALVKAALDYLKLFEDQGFNRIVVSVKASTVSETVRAYRLLSQKTDYPLHLGLTEAGPLIPGTVKSTLALGQLLKEGIGDTIRVSLTGNPVNEVRVGFELLKALGLRKGPDLISCPICGRCEIDLEALVQEVERALWKVPKAIKVAVMGCSVNGPGEAKEADVGIAGGKNSALLFVRGKVIKKLRYEEILPALLEEIEKIPE